MVISTQTTPFRLDLPLVVPSFSSRGFPQDRHRLPVVTRNHFKKFAGAFDTLLVSAFDVHFNYVRRTDIPGSRLVFVDSGGYEAREWEDDSATHLKPLPHYREKWTRQLLAKTIRSLPDKPNFVYVNYDLESDLPAQVRSATRQLRDLRFAKRSFLLKEEPRRRHGKVIPGQMVPLASTLAKLPEAQADLAKFDVFGVTEKSLGTSYRERLANLHLLSRLLRKLDLNLPIHVFGALDPLSVRAYALAGANIFDGLTWIRFAYREQQCLYLANDILVESDLSDEITEGRDAVYARNYGLLRNLQDNLQKYRQTDNPKHLHLPKVLLTKVSLAISDAEQSEPFKKIINPRKKTRFPLASTR